MAVVSGESDMLREDAGLKVHSLPRHQTRWFSRGVRQLPSSRLAMIGKTLVLIIVARIAVLILPVRLVLAWKARPVAGGMNYTRRELLTVAREVAWAVERIVKGSPMGVNCLTQCLAAAALLRSAGVDSRLHYGVVQAGGKRTTHTWLEGAGEVLVGREISADFSSLDVY